MREALGRDPVVERGEPINLLVDGEVIRAYIGETIAGALTAEGRRVFRHTARTGAPRGVFCGIGICFDCQVAVEGMGWVRSCMVSVQPGMRVSLLEGEASGRRGGSATD
jgi:hypothetical protein